MIGWEGVALVNLILFVLMISNCNEMGSLFFSFAVRGVRSL